MKEWEFEELKEGVGYCFERELKRRNVIQAAERTFYDYEPVIKEGKAEELIVNTTIGTLMVNNGNRIFIGQLNLIQESINSFDPQKLKGELKDSEIEQLSKEISLLKSNFNNIKVITNVADIEENSEKNLSHKRQEENDARKENPKKFIERRFKPIKESHKYIKRRKLIRK